MPSTSSLISSSLILKIDFFLSNIDICSTFSTRKRRRLLSSFITPPRCVIICSFFFTLLSPSICEASDMLEIGVFSSCVMLLMKSLRISENLFWRNITTMVKMKVMSNTPVNTSAGIIKCTLE